MEYPMDSAPHIPLSLFSNGIEHMAWLNLGIIGRMSKYARKQGLDEITLGQILSDIRQ